MIGIDDEHGRRILSELPEIAGEIPVLTFSAESESADLYAKEIVCHPEVFLKAAEFLGMDPKDCLVVEDAEAGLDAAIAGGMECAAIGEATKCGKGTYNLTTFSDLLKI